MAFTFKQFHIDDFGCGMPVSTDSVLLGSWTPLTTAKRILDIGAGSGLLSLMAAQRNNIAQIDAVELDATAADACRRNIAASPWATRIVLHHCSIQHFTEQVTTKNLPQYDVIICNPPYFLSGPTSAQNSRASARHTLHLNFDELMQSCQSLLNADGIACMVLPMVESQALMTAAEANGIPLQLAVSVSSVRGKSPNRQLLLFSRNKAPKECVTQDFDVLVQHGVYSDTMRALTQDFYLKL